MQKIILCCFLVFALFPSVILGVAINDPVPENLAVLDNTRDGIEFSWQSDFSAEEYNFELWQIDGDGNKNVIIAKILTKPKFLFNVVLLRGEYFWQVSATRDTDVKVISPEWRFFCKPWFDIYIDKTSLLMFVRFPGEFILKWTKVMLASNASIKLVFDEILLVDEHNNILPAIFGLKQNGNDIQWKTGQWEMSFENPLQAQEFEIWLKITADAQVSVGDYKGVIKAHALIGE